MEEYISISTLNDFIFCPYSIYLHNVYMDTDEELYSAIFILTSMLIVSYDISDDKLRTKFSKMLEKNGAVRLQMSVYEINNTKRIMEIVKLQIESKFAKLFSGGDSVMVMEVNDATMKKYGNAIHRDQEILYF